jgi:hypothetical protein
MMRTRSTEWRKIRKEMESTAHVMGEDYVNMVLSDMSESEIYPGWEDEILDEDSLEYLREINNS